MWLAHEGRRGAGGLDLFWGEYKVQRAWFCALGVCHRDLCIVGFGFSSFLSVLVVAAVGSVLSEDFTNPGC